MKVGVWVRNTVDSRFKITLSYTKVRNIFILLHNIQNHTHRRKKASYNTNNVSTIMYINIK